MKRKICPHTFKTNTDIIYTQLVSEFHQQNINGYIKGRDDPSRSSPSGGEGQISNRDRVSSAPVEIKKEVTTIEELHVG